MPRSTEPRTHCRNGHELIPENTRLMGDGERRCRQCERERDEARRRAKGIEARKPGQNRAEYQRNYQRDWIAKRRADWFKGKCCVKCGSTERLEADHIDRTTKDPGLKKGTNLWSWSDERREAELAKCQPLCHDCHKAKTKADEAATRKHGTRRMYYEGGCRCQECKGAVKDYNARKNALRAARRAPGQS